MSDGTSHFITQKSAQQEFPVFPQLFIAPPIPSPQIDSIIKEQTWQLIWNLESKLLHFSNL